MKNSFTLNDFFLSGQNESDEWWIQELIKSGISLQEPLPEQFSPDKRVLSNIMGYSQALYVLKTNHAGVFSILMN
jgi:hypothetical protein